MELRQQLVHEVSQVGGVPKKLESIGSPGRKWQIGTPPERSKPGIFQDFQAVSGWFFQ